MLFRVKTSRHFTPEEAARKPEEWKEALSNGGVPISPYIHPHEKELKKIAIDEGYSIIRVCANGFSDRSAATGNEFELISEGRLLLIGQPEFNTRKQELTYSSAQDLNRLARHIAEACNSGTPFTLRKL